MFLLKRTTRKLHVILLFLCFVLQQTRATSVPGDILDYYWREYNGIIPTDALPGGMDTFGNPTYIGQIYREGAGAGLGLLPATIYRGSKIALSSGSNLSFSSQRYVKILCSRSHEKFRWLPTRNVDSHLLTNCHLIVGGTEGGFMIHIGRVTNNGETIIGKVFDNKGPWHGIKVPHQDIEIDFQTYEILTYDCNIINQCGGNISFIDLRMAP